MSVGNKKINNLFRSFLVLLTTVSMPSIAFAQDETPGDGCDPYDGCYVPLDTWVFVLVAIAFIYAVYHLHKKQKSFSA